MRRCPTFVLTLLVVVLPVVAQDHAQFQLSLAVDVASAAKTIELYEGMYGRPGDVAQLRGSHLVRQITAALSQRGLTVEDLTRALESAKYNQALGDDVFLMQEARQRARELKELLDALQRRNFAQKVVSTVQQLFPPDARVQARLPMYVVAFGHQNIDAFVTRVLWRGDVPSQGGTEGELVIVLNLAKALHYGSTTDERFVGVLSVVAHEVFHAAFDLYKESSPVWVAWRQRYRGPFDQFIDLVQNEGIAYYLSLIQRTQGRLPPDGLQRANTAMAQFNEAAAELLSPDTGPRRAYDIIRLSNTSGYWESYGSITGMIIARQIDQTLGRETLVRTLVQGPHEFFATYAELMRRDSGIPALSPRVLQEISRHPQVR